MTLSLMSASSNEDNADSSFGELTSVLSQPRPCQTLNSTSSISRYNHRHGFLMPWSVTRHCKYKCVTSLTVWSAADCEHPHWYPLRLADATKCWHCHCSEIANCFRIKILPSVALCSKIKYFLVSRSGLLVFSTQHWDLWGLRTAFRFTYLSSVTSLSLPSHKIVLFPHPISVHPERGARLAPLNTCLTQPSSPQDLLAGGSSGTKRVSFVIFFSFYRLLLCGLPSKLWFLKCENPAVEILRSSFSISGNGELSRLSMASP